MGTRGPLPTDETTLKLTGAYRKDRHADRNLVALPPGRPTAPAFLDAVAKREFVRLCDVLAGLGALSPAYRAVIAVVAASWSEFLRASKVLANGPDPVASRQFNDAHRALLAGLRELGLTPASRLRVHAGSPSKPSPDNLDDFAKNKPRVTDEAPGGAAR